MNIYTPTPKDKQIYNDWMATRPPHIQEVARRFRPWRLYRLATSGCRVTIDGFGEDGTVSVFVSGKYNATPFEHRVFGVDPDDLGECELPPLDEPVGATLTTQEDIHGF